MNLNKSFLKKWLHVAAAVAELTVRLPACTILPQTQPDIQRRHLANGFITFRQTKCRFMRVDQTKGKCPNLRVKVVEK